MKVNPINESSSTGKLNAKPTSTDRLHPLPTSTTRESIESKHDSTFSTPSGSIDEKQSSESKDSFFSFLRKILGQDIDSLRITIPMFLLEPISNLQYLSHLEHLEDYALAGTSPDPLDRFLHILKFIIGSWKRALKKSKKPLNPVLGETIQAHYYQTNKEGQQGSAVYLLGEQISHHPPIAAFYVTCPENNIDSVTIFDVKAKFDGTSLRLNNQSVTDIYVKNHDEVYRIEFPDAIIVGVLTMQISLLWRGTCTLTCKKTGLSAKLHFKEQNWFGKPVYDLTGEILKDSTLIASLKGQWNDKLYLQRLPNSSSSSTSTSPELFYSCSTPLKYDAQITEDSPTFKVWGKVIEAMKAEDFSNAKKLKTEIENYQRMLEKERKVGKRAPYTPVYFSLISSDQLGSKENASSSEPQDRWIYTGPSLPFQFPTS